MLLVHEGADTAVSDVDGRPYTTLLYGNGPGYSSPRVDNSSGVNAVHGSAVPRQWATHGGEDVPVYAQGPMATKLFSGTVDQSYIPHAVAYAACLGEQGNSRRCQRRNETHHPQTVTTRVTWYKQIWRYIFYLQYSLI